MMSDEAYPCGWGHRLFFSGRPRTGVQVNEGRTGQQENDAKRLNLGQGGEETLWT